MDDNRPNSLELAQTIRQRMAGRKLNHQKLQKLCCLVDGWWLAYEDAPLTRDRQACMDHGPLYKELYQFLSGHGTDPLPEVLAGPMGSPNEVPYDNVKAHNLIKWVVGRYGALSDFELSTLLSAEDSAWKAHVASQGHQVRRWEEIPVDTIRRIYTAKRNHEGI